MRSPTSAGPGGLCCPLIPTADGAPWCGKLVPRPGCGVSKQLQGLSMCPCRSGWTGGAGCAKACSSTLTRLLRPAEVIQETSGALRLATVRWSRSCCRPAPGAGAQAAGTGHGPGAFPVPQVGSVPSSELPTLFALDCPGFRRIAKHVVSLRTAWPHGDALSWHPWSCEFGHRPLLGGCPVPPTSGCPCS